MFYSFLFSTWVYRLKTQACGLLVQRTIFSSLFWYTSLGPHHELMVIPTVKMPSPSNSPSTGILIKEERPDYTNILFQDSQDPWEDFTSLLHPAEASDAPSTSSVLPIDSPTCQYYTYLPWWKEPFAEVDSDVDSLSPSHSHWWSYLWVSWMLPL